MEQTRIKVFGPPGTGKTTFCIDLLCDHLMAGDKVLFISFTRAAKEEAHRRMQLLFGEIPKQARVSTIHAYCMKMLRIPPVCIFETQRDVKMKFYRTVDHMGMNNTAIKQTLSLYQRLRNEQSYSKAIFDQCRDLEVDDIFTSSGLDSMFVEKYEEWKKHEAYIDFTTVVEKVVAGEGTPDPFDVVIIDEAQDLTTLQWHAVARIYEAARTVYVVGDDDQSIYSFLGADVHSFLSWDCSVVRQLDHTYRLPQKILDYSLRIADRISYRQDKTIKTNVDREGHIYRAALSDSLRFNELDSELYLVRNDYMLDRVKDILLLDGVPYRGRRSPWESRSVQSIQTIMGWETRELSDHDWRMTKHVFPTTFVKFIEDTCPLLHERNVPVVIPPLRKLLDNTLFNRPFWWELLLPKIHPQILPGIKLGIRNYGVQACMNPKMELSTIHGAKGKEADRVYLCSGLTDKIKNSLDTKDDEHRLFYVGVTRAKKELFLIDDLFMAEENNYPFPTTKE